MNEEALKLVARMVVSSMAGKRKWVHDLHEKYLRATRLHVTIREYIDWRRKNGKAC